MTDVFHKVHGDITPLANVVLVSDLEFGERKTSSGIIIPDDDGKERGVRPRWAKVYKVGKKVDEVMPGEWVLISHGRWTRGVTLTNNNESVVIRMIDRNDILLVTDEAPTF
ncbi:MAG: hypothetical protein HC836_30355 [Richelia sp. RM2_1_2]|nr:hypothetical protein [Richelia sp. RM2_1_2]